MESEPQRMLPCTDGDLKWPVVAAFSVWWQPHRLYAMQNQRDSSMEWSLAVDN